MVTPRRPLQTIPEIVQDTLSGKAHLDAWCAVVNALRKADPRWCADTSKSPVENAVAWIEKAAVQSNLARTNNSSK